jgi:molybdate transport system permease protein
MRHTLAILVFAAASLTDALQEIGALYERDTGTRVVFNFAGSSTLARQIENGAPADLFLSADEASMDRVRTETRVRVLTNDLVVVVPAESRTKNWRTVERIAIAEPSSVPAGVYAKKWLTATGEWSRLEPQLVPTENVRAALAAVTSGSAGAAIVYRSDANRGVRIVEEAPPLGISYPFAVLATAPQKAEAEKFLAYLQTEEAALVFAKFGFRRRAKPPASAFGDLDTVSAGEGSGGRNSESPPAIRTEEATAHRDSILEPVALTLVTAALSTLLLLIPGLATAWVLARRQWRGKSLVETLVALPLVMPPVATGLILLELIAPFRGIVFTWRAVVLAMFVMSFPLFVRAARVAIENVSPRFEQIARTLGASETRVFFTITLPLAKRGVVSGTLLAFARAVGEFGATILVAGNIPGRTRTLSLAIYNVVQLGHDAQAFRLLAISVVLAFAAVYAAEAFVRKAHESRSS